MVYTVKQALERTLPDMVIGQKLRNPRDNTVYTIHPKRYVEIYLIPKTDDINELKTFRRVPKDGYLGVAKDGRKTIFSKDTIRGLEFVTDEE